MSGLGTFVASVFPIGMGPKVKWRLLESKAGKADVPYTFQVHMQFESRSGGVREPQPEAQQQDAIYLIVEE
ncbi:hypothetical protein GCM10017653_25150 [Ancylobacter defluvii]|uniref:Uncharacterized protein n=1 Tax=Ancylobacter defluvii TaxID=1282440 RepID=A0A9W6NBB8_9HYPH|nr:hypothetical protein GCM10017653_25150 [Ancylobacter defluvii]